MTGPQGHSAAVGKAVLYWQALQFLGKCMSVTCLKAEQLMYALRKIKFWSEREKKKISQYLRMRAIIVTDHYLWLRSRIK